MCKKEGSWNFFVTARLMTPVHDQKQQPPHNPKTQTKVLALFNLVKPLQITAKHCADVKKEMILTHYRTSETTCVRRVKEFKKASYKYVWIQSMTDAG